MRKKKKGYSELAADIARAFIFGLIVLANFYAAYYFFTHVISFNLSSQSLDNSVYDVLLSLSFSSTLTLNTWIAAFYLFLIMIDSYILMMILPPCDFI